MTYQIPSPREIPSWVKGQLPTQAMADLLRRHRQDLSTTQEKIDQASKRTCDLAEAFGLALWKKRSSANSQDFRTLWDALDNSGVEFIDQVGAPIEGELEVMADIIDWVDSAEGIEPGCVAEAFEPEIRIDGVLAHRAKLIGVLEETDSSSRSHDNTRGEPSPQPGEPSPQPGEPSPQPDNTSGEPSPQPGEPSPRVGEPSPRVGEPSPQPDRRTVPST